MVRTKHKFSIDISNFSSFTFFAAPVFFPREYNVTLQKSAVVGHQVVVVRANDADSSQFGEVSYFIDSGNDAGKFAVNHFKVDQDSGVLIINIIVFIVYLQIYIQLKKNLIQPIVKH